MFKKAELISKQGKAAASLYPNMFGSVRPASVNAVRKHDKPKKIEKILQELMMEEEEVEDHSKSRRGQSWCFTNVSRAKREHIYRDQTQSPNVGKYNPSFSITEKRTNHGPQYRTETTSPRKKSLFIPYWMDEDIDCTYPAPRMKGYSVEPETPMEFTGFNMTHDEFCRRTATGRDWFCKRAEIKEKKSMRAVPNKPQRKQKVVDFKRTLDRTPFVKESDPPHAERFNLDNPSPVCNSKYKRPQTCDLKKRTKRKPLWPDYKGAPYYDFTLNGTARKLSLTVMEFAKTPDRPDNILKQQLQNPEFPEKEALEKSQKMVSKRLKGNMTMKSHTPRDDKMYRTTERYLMNVPVRQMATEVPHFNAYGSTSGQTTVNKQSLSYKTS